MSIGKTIARLTKEEMEIIEAGKDNPSLVTDHFFRRKGRERGWRFDYNFDPEGAWQEAVHIASQRRIVIIGGFGTGKTRGVGMSACVHCLTTMDFAFLNAAPRAWQTELMYKFIISSSRGAPFERLIYRNPQKPYPLIELRFYYENTLIVSTMEFMSAEKNAEAILGWEGDWANIDEGGLLDDLGGTITNLGSRMRGSTDTRPRLGRLSICSNSWDNPELWYRYDMASSLPQDYLSITVSTRHNHNVTDDQLRLMLKDIPEEEHQQFIDATRPEGRGNYFASTRIYACEDQNYGDFIIAGANQGLSGYEISSVYGAGVVYFKTPRMAGNDYIVLGDPGVEDAPNRNSPAVQVWDVTDCPKYKARLAAFWWGAGHGTITPFVKQMLKFIAIYNPFFAGVDSTGPQKNFNQVMNSFVFGEEYTQKGEWLEGIKMEEVLIKEIGGLDFSGGKKPRYLISGRLAIESGLVYWPKFVVGMRSQLSNYDPEKDKPGKPKIAQDLVATFCMSAHIIRARFGFDSDVGEDKEDGTEPGFVTGEDFRSQRLPIGDRSLRIR